MAMVGVVSGSLYRRTHSLSRLAWSWVILHSSNEPGELSQCLCHDDSTINIVVLIIIILLLRKARRGLGHCTKVQLKGRDRSSNFENSKLELSDAGEASRRSSRKERRL